MKKIVTTAVLTLAASLVAESFGAKIESILAIHIVLLAVGAYAADLAIEYWGSTKNGESILRAMIFGGFLLSPYVPIFLLMPAMLLGYHISASWLTRRKRPSQ